MPQIPGRFGETLRTRPGYGPHGSGCRCHIRAANKIFTTLPPAATARQVVEQGLFIKAKEQAARIEKDIQKGIQEGKRQVVIYENLLLAVKTALESLNYKVIEHSAMDMRDENTTTISW